jgi:thiamine transporter
MKKTELKLAESAILVALAIVLDITSKMIPVLQMPQGGSISLALLPLVILSLRNGYKYGFLGGMTFGIVNFLMDGYAFHWGSFIFDYGLAFILVGTSAIFSKKTLKGNVVAYISAFVLAVFLKYLMSSFSGVLFFAEFSGDMNPWFYSFVFYNLPYNAASLGAILIVALLIYRRLLAFFNQA